MNDVNWVVLLLVCLQAKHFVADFVLQSDWIAAHKNTYGHPAAFAHIGWHMGFSLPILLLFNGPLAASVLIVAIEGIVHMHIDWCKGRAVRLRKLTSKQRLFWVFTGLDQSLHQATYLGMVAVLATVVA